MSGKIKNIIFDFDGVIADSFDMVLEILSIGYPFLTSESLRKYYDGNINFTLLNQKPVKKFNLYEEYAKRYDKIKLFPNVTKTIKNLAKKYNLFLVSSAETQNLKDYLSKHKIINYFKDILGKDIEKSKEKKFQLIFNKYEAKKDETIFITDTSGDISEANNIGLKAVGITHGFQSRKSLEKAKPYAIIDKFEEIERFL